VSAATVDRVVAIDFLPESARGYGGDWAVVAIDIMRATTTAVTIANSGRRCLPARDPDAARKLADSLTNPLLVGEFGGDLPEGFDLQNSPATLESRNDLGRPAILVSSSGTRLLHEAAGAAAVYPACLRNAGAVAAHLIERHPRVAVIGAGTKGAFRREDQYGCARIAEPLVAAGYRLANEETTAVIKRWRDQPVEVCAGGRSAEYLRRTGQTDDLEFVLTRIEDVPKVFRFAGGELVEEAGA
jgi:2-phosphosulfolactate phosphatase